jgi:hypothetical protein
MRCVGVEEEYGLPLRLASHGCPRPATHRIRSVVVRAGREASPRVSTPTDSPRSIASGPAAGVASAVHSGTNNLHLPLPKSLRHSPGAASTACPTSTWWRLVRVRLVASRRRRGRVDLPSASFGRARSPAQESSPPYHSIGGRGRAPTRAVPRPDTGSSGERPLPSYSRSPVSAEQPEVQSAVPDDAREHPLLRSIEVAHHAISTLPDANLSTHRLAPECFLVIFPTRRTMEAASTTRASPSLVAEATEACSEFVAFESQLPFRPPSRTRCCLKLECHLQGSPRRMLVPGSPPLPRHRSRPIDDGLAAARHCPASAALHQHGPAVESSPPAACRDTLDHASDPPRTPRRTRQDQIATPSKRVRSQANSDPEAEATKATTAAFLASVRQALQVPLATLPAAPSPSTTTTTRRSSRLAKDTMNSTVRASKKGEVLLMRRLGKLDKQGSSPSDEP